MTLKEQFAAKKAAKKARWEDPAYVFRKYESKRGRMLSRYSLGSNNVGSFSNETTFSAMNTFII